MWHSTSDGVSSIQAMENPYPRHPATGGTMRCPSRKKVSIHLLNFIVYEGVYLIKQQGIALINRDGNAIYRLLGKLDLRHAQ
jgi:hypothetical protein